MPDDWWDENPIIQQLRTTSKVETLQGVIVKVVSVSFPSLADLARQKVNQINDEQKLRNLLVQISIAQDEVSARSLLAPTAA